MRNRVVRYKGKWYRIIHIIADFRGHYAVWLVKDIWSASPAFPVISTQCELQ
jgi:hypothetical protein